MNDIGTVTVETNRPVLFDLYSESRRTGSFILVDPGSNNTVAAGMILAPEEISESSNAYGQGLFVRADSKHSAATALQSLRKANAEGDVVMLSNWNKKAADLLVNAGIHVIMLDSEIPAEAPEYQFSTVEQLLAILQPAAKNDLAPANS